MVKLVIRSQIFLLLTLLVGTQVKANFLSGCIAMANFRLNLDSLLDFKNKDSLDTGCRHWARIFECINDHFKMSLGLNLKDVTVLLDGTELGKAFSHLSRMENFIGELCTEGNELHEGIKKHYWCFGRDSSITSKICKRQGEQAFEIFSELQSENVYETKDCLVMAHTLACLASEVHKSCGNSSYNVLLKLYKGLGVLQNDICNSLEVQSVKSSFIDSLKIVDSQKNLYRDVFELRKRRK